MNGYDYIIIDGVVHKSELYLGVEKHHGITPDTIRVYKLKIAKEGVIFNNLIYQLYYQKHAILDPGFIPRLNVEPNRSKNPIQENLDIIYTYYNEREIWSKVNFIGFFSAKFTEKTKLTSQEVFTQLDKSCQIYSVSPKRYDKNTPMYLKTEVNGIQEICKFIDSKEILSHKLEGYNKYLSYCNYWLMSPYYFEDYVKNWLIPVYNLIYKCDEAKKLFDYKYYYINDYYCTLVFFFEGLFSVFLDGKEFKYIRK